jgi:hypothetical protein
MSNVHRGARIYFRLAIAALLVTAALHAGRTSAGQAGVSIATDRTQYQPGDTIQICYMVPARGPVEIRDLKADGSNSLLLSVDDDGTGWCFNGMATPPTGRECLLMGFGEPSVGRQSESCFQVVAQTPPVTGGDCGTVTLRGPRPLEANAAQIEGCFYQAYLSCAPATLELQVRGVDTGASHMFSISGNGSPCIITDVAQRFVFPSPVPSTTGACTGLSQTPDGGLQFTACGPSGDVSVPAS